MPASGLEVDMEEVASKENGTNGGGGPKRASQGRKRPTGTFSSLAVLSRSGPRKEHFLHFCQAWELPEDVVFVFGAQHSDQRLI